MPYAKLHYTETEGRCALRIIVRPSFLNP